MPPTGDVLKTSADVSLAEKELDYKPTTPLQDGIKKFIEWYDEYYKELSSPSGHRKVEIRRPRSRVRQLLLKDHAT